MSAFHDAIVGSITAQMDPMNSVVRSLAGQMVEKGKDEIDNMKISTMQRLQGILADLEKREGVTDAEKAPFQKLLNSYS